MYFDTLVNKNKIILAAYFEVKHLTLCTFYFYCSNVNQLIFVFMVTKIVVQKKNRELVFSSKNLTLNHAEIFQLFRN